MNRVAHSPYEGISQPIRHGLVHEGDKLQGTPALRNRAIAPTAKYWRARSGPVSNATPLILHVEPYPGKPNESDRNDPGSGPVLRIVTMQTVGANVDITHTELVDDAVFTRSYPLIAGQVPRKVRSYCTTLDWVAKIHTPGQTATVNVACVDGPSDAFSDYIPVNYNANVASSASSDVNIVTGSSGVILAATVTAKAVTAPWYPMFVDATSGAPPTSGVSTPIPGSTGAIIAAAGVQDNWLDQNLLGQLPFTSGVWLCLSTTPDVFTQVGAGNTAVCAITVGV